MRMDDVAYGSLEASTRLLKALADPVRLRILHLLSANDEICVCHLVEALKLPQPTVSRHLAYLRKHGVVTASKTGLWVHYALARADTSFQRAVMTCLQENLAGSDELERDDERLKWAVARCSPD